MFVAFINSLFFVVSFTSVYVIVWLYRVSQSLLILFNFFYRFRPVYLTVSNEICN